MKKGNRMRYHYINVKYRLNMDNRNNTFCQEEDNIMASVVEWFNKLERVGLDFFPKKKSLLEKIKQNFK